MVYYKYSEIKELTFRWIYTKHNLLYKYKPVIFSLLCRYANLPSDEAILFWKKLSNVVRNMPIEFL